MDLVRRGFWKVHDVYRGKRVVVWEGGAYIRPEDYSRAQEINEAGSMQNVEELNKLIEKLDANPKRRTAIERALEKGDLIRDSDRRGTFFLMPDLVQAALEKPVIIMLDGPYKQQIREEEKQTRKKHVALGYLLPIITAALGGIPGARTHLSQRKDIERLKDESKLNRRGRRGPGASAALTDLRVLRRTFLSRLGLGVAGGLVFGDLLADFIRPRLPAARNSTNPFYHAGTLQTAAIDSPGEIKGWRDAIRRANTLLNSLPLSTFRDSVIVRKLKAFEPTLVKEVLPSSGMKAHGKEPVGISMGSMHTGFSDKLKLNRFVDRDLTADNFDRYAFPETLTTVHCAVPNPKTGLYELKNYELDLKPPK